MTTQARRTYWGALVDRLLFLDETADTLSDSRAALAELRRGLEEPLRIAKHVAPYLPAPRNSEDGERETRLYTLAALCAYHRKPVDGMSLGHAFRRINDESGSIEGRFLALIGARPAQVETQLRHAVRLLASKGAGLDWHLLAEALWRWDEPGKPVQRRLARDFYGAGTTGSTTVGAETPAEGDTHP